MTETKTTVRELIEKLKEFDGDLEVFICDVNFDNTTLKNIENVRSTNILEVNHKLMTLRWAKYTNQEQKSNSKPFNGIIIK
jgi:hypothetical protein